jgi:hypothetical protein
MNKKLLALLLFFLLFGVEDTFSQSVVINEVLASNSAVNVDEDGSYEDWVELYNNGANPVNLNGYGLTDNSNSLFKWVFPNVTINPGSYLLVYCSDKNRINPAEPLHANFKISADGETISLTNPEGVVVDFAPATPMAANISYGRMPNGTGSFAFFDTPTPGATNIGSVFSETLQVPIFSQNSGFYTSQFDLTISSSEPDVTIIYTLDGSEPDENNFLGTTYQYKNQYPKLPTDPFGSFIENSYQTLQYAAPITIVDRSPVANKISAISTTYDYTPTYFPNAPIFKSTIVKARAIKAGARPSPIVTRTYFITPLGSARFTLPVVSISTNEDRFFEYNNGIHVAGKDFDTWRTNNPNRIPDYEIGNFARKGATAERVSNISMFMNGNEIVNNTVGVRIRGNYSRIYPSKAFNIYSRSEHGDSRINYKLFEDQTYQSYERLTLKSSSGDQYHTLFRDPLNHEIIKGMRVETEAYRPVITFVNGEYWGVQSLREKYDDKYFERVFGIDGDELDVLENNAEIEEGDAAHYLAMINYVENNSLATTQNYEYIKTQMDTDSFQDYFISNIYLQNVDWPGNNIIYWRKKTAAYVPNAPYGHDGRWRWAIHDMDSTFGISGGNNYLNSLADATAAGGTSWPNPDWSTLLLRKLLENAEFKQEFISRFADVMNTYFHSNRVVAKINEIKNILQPEMNEHIQRWKAPSSISSWNYFLDREIGFANERPGFQRDHIRGKFEISNNINATIDVSSEEHGHVKLNTIDILATTPGINANPYPWTGVYFSNVPVKLTAIAKNGYVFSHWEGFSTSTNAEISVVTNSNFSIKAVFIPEGFAIENHEPIYFWMLNSALPNDTPMTSINSTFEIQNDGVLSYKSCLEGYPFENGDANWRIASMERRNSPTDLNYMPSANNNLPFGSSNMRGIQIKQPFQSNGLENEMHFNFSTVGYKDIIFGFAAKDENAADAIVVDYSIDGSNWISTGLVATSLPLSENFQLYEVDFSAISAANNNSSFKVRLRFTGENMTVNNGDRVTFNNFSVKGVVLPLQYPTPNVFTVGQTITNIIPSLTAVADSFSIEPSLPNGLSFDTTTGVISGTPTAIQSATSYEVTATNSGGSTSFTLSIAVIDVTPSSLSYTTPNVFTVDTAITSLTPTVLGENLVFSIAPSLPNGLSFDITTGEISGTPTAIQSATDYEVTATNSGGSTSFTVSIAIIDVAPTALSYTTPNIFTVDTAITSLNPTVSGENLVFSIAPSLPNGLSFDTTTGIISGTPTAIQSATSYEVTATNSGGSTSFTVSIAVIDVTPSSLSYTTPNIFTVNSVIASLTPTVSGENVVFSIAPSVPNGLSFDTTTGVISGTPTAIQSATNYEVTATNSGGSTSFTVSIAIIDVTPSSLSYTTPNIFTVDEAITSLNPTVSGENLVFSIVPSLPNGLSFDTITGIISGTSTVNQSATNYQVTATNSGGSVSFTLSIAVIDVVPTALSYTTPNIFTVDEAITSLNPTVSGENLVFSIAPSLPNGLSFDTVTGVISGTPTAIQSATNYEVTATNSGGSTSFTVSIAIEEELGVVDNDKQLFKVYPNPFDNEINVVHNFDEVDYAIFSLDGRQIHNGRLLNSKIFINALPTSVYLLKLQSEGKTQIIKIVKQ